MNYSRRHGPYIKTDNEITLMEKACRIVADSLSLVGKNVRPGVSTLELDAIAEEYIRSQGAVPAFKGYEVDGLKFPNTLCISVNEEIVHGIPSQRKLVDGDIVSVDCGCEKQGYFGDSAVTFAVGQVSDEKQKLMKVTQEALMLGISQAVQGNKVYDISRAVQEHVESNGFSVTRELVGHGIGKRLHEEPSIPNFVPPLLHRNNFPNEKLLIGMALAIEPMVHAGTQRSLVADNGWTVFTADRKPSAHFEHTVIVTAGQPIILTLRD